MNREVIKQIGEILPAGQIFPKEPMRKHTTFRVGGEAALFLEVGSPEQLKKLTMLFRRTETEYFVVGNGSNLLVSDDGYDGVILHLGAGMGEIRTEGKKLFAQAGALLSRAAAVAMEHSLTGLEFASGIPGSVGGGVMMNAGAYGGEMSQIVEAVTGIDRSGKRVRLSNEELEFGYRSSRIKKEKIIVTEAEFLLSEGKIEEIRAKMQDFTNRRKEKQPLEYFSAGSTFKRPEGYFAGKLIMDAGLRGYQVGGAQVSEKHCGFVVNKGNATAADICAVMSAVQERVKEKFGVMLEPEVIRLGAEK